MTGTPDGAWRRLLAGAACLNSLVPPVLIVAPHPDDETLGAGGLQLRYPAARLIVVTDGEAARLNEPNLAPIRRREVTMARQCLGSRGGAPIFLGLPDGCVSAQEDRLERLLASRLRGVSTLVGPYEHDGHPDHDVVGRVCMRLARRHGLTLLRYPIWAWHRLDAKAFRSGHFVKMSLNARQQQAKQRAIACFRSQLQGDSDAVLPPHVLNYFQRPYEAFLQ